MRSRKYFKCSDRDRASFEAGIKLASLYHQYVGAPVNRENISYLEDAMENGLLAQPYVVSSSVKIDMEVLDDHLSHYGYASLNDRMIEAMVIVEYMGIRVKASMGWIDELNYPLMRIDSIGDIER